LFDVEARIGEFAEAESAGRGAELEVAGVLLVAEAAGVLEVARRIAVAGLADVLQELGVARAPLEAVGLLQALRRAAGGAGRAAAGIVDQAPDLEAVVALVRAQH